MILASVLRIWLRLAAHARVSLMIRLSLEKATIAVDRSLASVKKGGLVAVHRVGTPVQDVQRGVPQEAEAFPKAVQIRSDFSPHKLP